MLTIEILIMLIDDVTMTLHTVNHNVVYTARPITRSDVLRLQSYLFETQRGAEGTSGPVLDCFQIIW